MYYIWDTYIIKKCVTLILHHHHQILENSSLCKFKRAVKQLQLHLNTPNKRLPIANMKGLKYLQSTQVALPPLPPETKLLDFINLLLLLLLFSSTFFTSLTLRLSLSIKIQSLVLKKQSKRYLLM